MKTIRFKTNIKCGGCIATVTPYLNQVEGIEKWEVDTASPDKILSVETEKVSAEEIRNTVEQAGFRAETV